MEIFSIIFAVLMIAAAIAATIFVGLFAGGFWGALAFAAVIVLIYRAMTHETGRGRRLRRDNLNAFQRPLSDD